MTQENKIKILQNVPISEIKPYEKNYQKHDANLEHIKNSIKDFDFDVPIVVDVNNVIVKGHGRYEALKELGKDTIPLVAINMALDTKKKASAARIADNESSKAAVVDNDILKFELDLIGEDFEMEDYGLDLGNFDIEILEPEETEGDDDVPESAPAITVLGDIYELGGVHRVMCGDSLSSDAVERLMDGQKADLIFTDPPYNIAEKGKNVASNVKEGKAYNVLKNSKWDYGFIVEDFLNNINIFSTETASFFIFTSHFLFGNIQKWMDDNLDYNNYCVWCKPNPMPSLTKKRFTWATELINYGSKNKHFFNFKSEGHLFNYLVENSPAHTTQHPTEKPLKVLMYFLDVLSDKNSIILDSFCGSGSTLISCEKLGRKCYGMELDPKYCDVIVKRYVTFCKANNKPYSVFRNGKVCKDFDI